ncbi:MAG: hypothetical protein U5K75_03175 [Ahrensia sp.]|nr:hypothetical protein [Ahrensia sp.]
MDDIAYRRILSPEDFEAVGRLRQKAFDKYDIYEEKFDNAVIEDIDFGSRKPKFSAFTIVVN